MRRNAFFPPVLLRKGASCSVLSKAAVLQVLRAWDGETRQTSVPTRVEWSRGSSASAQLLGAREVWPYGSLPIKWGRAESACSQGEGQSGPRKRNSAVAYFGAVKFESTPKPHGFPWTHPLLPSGIERARKFACCFGAGFTRIFPRSGRVADVQAEVIAVAGIELSRQAALARKPTLGMYRTHGACVGFYLTWDSEGG